MMLVTPSHPCNFDLEPVMGDTESTITSGPMELVSLLKTSNIQGRRVANYGLGGSICGPDKAF